MLGKWLKVSLRSHKEEGENILIVVKAKPPKKSGKDIVHKTKELYDKVKKKQFKTICLIDFDF